MMPGIEQYILYRQKQVELNFKILDDCVHQAEIMQAARILGIVNRQNQLLLESAMEESAILDFNIYEKIREGKSTLSLFAESFSSDHPLETQLLKSMLHSEASLFEITNPDAKEGTLILNEILSGSGISYKLFDLSLSKTAKPNTIIYTRLLHLEGFSMTSGLGFVFSVQDKDYLLAESRKMMKKFKYWDVSTSRFIAFFHLNRTNGITTIFKNVN